MLKHGTLFNRFHGSLIYQYKLYCVLSNICYLDLIFPKGIYAKKGLVILAIDTALNILQIKAFVVSQ